MNHIVNIFSLTYIFLQYNIYNFIDYEFGNVSHIIHTVILTRI